MNDPLSRALEETSEPRNDPQLLDEHTPHPWAVKDILEGLRAQALELVALPFFDGDIRADVVPTRTVGKSESGAIYVSARRRKPPYHAELTIDVRCDRESQEQARYVAQGQCSMSSADNQPRYHREFMVLTVLGEDGSLRMDVDQIRDEMAAAIHSMGKLPD